MRNRPSLHLDQALNVDAAQSMFIERQLEYVEAEILRQPYPDLLARQLVPVSHRANAGAETISYRTYDRVGVAQRIKSYADNIVRADVSAKEDRVPIHGYGIGYGYSNQEMRAAAFAGTPLDSEKALAARQGFELRVDMIGASGNGEGLYGLLNLPNANVYTVPADGTGSSALWTAKSAALILRDMNGLSGKSISLTNGIERPDTLVLPLDQYTLIATTPWATTASDTTILEFFLKNSPWVKSVIPWYRCKAAGSGSTDRMVAYRRDPSKLRLEIPMEYQLNQPQLRNYGVEVPGEGRVAGVICPFPMSVTYGDGI